jgi:4-amino-4-deoxy-L-arabinose transferase-like glycosyltransferase
MFAAEFVLVLILLVVCCFSPGFFVVRRLHWTPLEKLCGSIGLSLILIYLTTWFVYIAGGPGANVRMSAVPFAFASSVCLVLMLVCRRDLSALLRIPRTRRALLGYVFLLLWTLLLLAMIRVYSGADWTGDWREHFQRALFFLWRLPKDTSFLEMYILPARPPLMNVVATYFLAQTDDRFELFQVIFLVLNLLVFLPCCLILPAITGARRTRILPLVALFALNPVVMQNVTYAWTKALAGFFVVLGVAFYLSAWRKQEQSRMIAAFLSLAAACLVHYSAGPYVLFLGLYYVLWLFWRRQRKVRELAAIFSVCAALLITWFAWSVTTYGSATFLSNTSVTSAQAYQGSNVVKAAANIFDSVVPVLLRDPSLLKRFEQGNSAGMSRDNAFLFYQKNIVFGMGIVGGPIVLWLLVRRFRRKRRRQESLFWMAFILFCALVGLAVVGERDQFGLAHLTLFALEVLGLTLLTNVFSRRRIVTLLVVAGAVVDFSLGVFLNAHVQSFEENSPRRIFGDLEFSESALQRAIPPDGLTDFAWLNWFGKHRIALCDQWLAKLPEHYGSNPAFESRWPVAKAEILKMRQEDEAAWGGWYSRHNGRIQYIGDHVISHVGEPLPAAVLLILMVPLIATLIRQTPIPTALAQRRTSHSRTHVRKR